MSIKYFILLFLIVSQISCNTPFTIIIDPSGDGSHTGREIDDTFERNLTLECAQELKEELSRIAPHVHVIITRHLGQLLQPLENAAFSSKIHTDFYLNIGFYQETESRSRLSIFNYLEKQGDLLHRYNPLYFYPVRKAHLINVSIDKAISQNFLNKLKDSSAASIWVAKGIFAIPYKPLLGVKAPCLAIEAGLKTKECWKELIPYLISCISELLSNHVKAGSSDQAQEG